MTNKDVAAVLQETADLIELTDGNPHRARAFSRAARTLSSLEDDVHQRAERGTLTEIDGIGDAMADHVSDIIASGTFEDHDELMNAIPPGLIDVLRVNGLGTKRTRRLWKELEITSLDELEEAAEQDRITALQGFGAKTQQNILENIRQLRAYENRWRLADVHAAVAPFLDDLRSRPFVERAEPTGPLRRHCETMEQADLIAATDKPDELASWLRSEADTVEEANSTLSLTLPEGIPLRIHTVSPSAFGSEWWKTTGNFDHCDEFEDRYGAPVDQSTEEAVFHSADLPVIPAELREGRGELEAAGDGSLPSLLSGDDLHGCLHNHSTFSDGADSVERMAEASRTLGYSYFGICDHSQSLQIAGGLSVEEVKEQSNVVRDLNEAYIADSEAPFRIFHGIESDIRRDGSLDYDDEVLSVFDFVVASVHTGFSMTEEEATARVIRAVENPHTRILGHPTGRLLLSRDGYPLDHERVIEACAEHDVALELNANPYRLDIDWRWIRSATERGVLISINPDAHSTEELRNVRWGVRVARKGWLEASMCLNAKPLAEFEDWIERGPSTA